MSEGVSEDFKPVDKNEALARWRKFRATSKKISESQIARHHDKHVKAAGLLRDGKGPRDIYREAGISPNATETAKMLMSRGEI